jgi:hypothetical protein
VLDDVLDEKVSRAVARDDYGVAIDGRGDIDHAETRRLRLARRTARP